YRRLELIKGPIRVAEHPGEPARPDLTLHTGVGTRPIRELHVLIEHLKTLPEPRQRQFELPLVKQRHAELHMRPNETGRIAKPFGDTQRLLCKMLGPVHIADQVQMVEIAAAERRELP